jgi:GH25 family lysozyme M1 (1,4-beta-N-acetylmuramidase)
MNPPTTGDLGIDYYAGEGALNPFGARCSGIRFVYHQISDIGKREIADPLAPLHWTLCERAGVLVSGYLFYRPGKPVAEQYRHFRDSLPGRPDFRTALDLEIWGAERKTLDEVGELLDLMDGLGAGRAALYCSLDACKKILRNPIHTVWDRPLWLAWPYDRPPTVPAPYGSVWMHQYSWSGRISGTKSAVDLNRLIGATL